MNDICPACKEQMDDGITRCVCGYEINLIPDYNPPSDLGETAIHSGALIINDTSAGYEIIIPPNKSGFIYLHSGLNILAICWIILELLPHFMNPEVFKPPKFNLPEVFKSPKSETELLFIIAIFAINSCLIIYEGFMNHTGKERIILTRGTITVTREIYGYGRKRVYDLSRMKSLRASCDAGTRPLVLWGCSIIIDNSDGKFGFGRSLSEWDARFIVNELNKRNPFRAG